jgi:uncharacterized protein (TIGR02246 family)
VSLLTRTLLSLGLLVLGLGSSAADAPDPRAADREALLVVFREMEAAINSQDVERMIAQMTPDATVVWLNAEVSRGHEEIRAYYHRMVKGKDRILDRYTTAAQLGAKARFYGDVAVADGSMEDAFFPVARGPFELSSRWTSTSVKIDGRWKVTSMHLSSNVFTNSLIAEAKQAAVYTAAGGVGGGMMLAGLVCWLRRRRPA